jgi:hypothetical protein
MAPTQLPETAVVRVASGTFDPARFDEVRIWESDEHAQQMSRLKEMIVDARSENERAGVTFPTPIINYPIDWAI